MPGARKDSRGMRLTEFLHSSITFLRLDLPGRNYKLGRD
jgi:hypothetical protein